MRQEIERLEQQLAELKAKIESKFDEWVISTNNSIVKLQNEHSGFGIDRSANNHDWREKITVEVERKATPTEIETALRKEWERRTKEKGWENPDEAEIEAHAMYSDSWRADLNSGNFESYYHEGFDILYTKNGCVYHNGNWATPKEKKSG